MEEQLVYCLKSLHNMPVPYTQLCAIGLSTPTAKHILR